ncbi:hypothetical protein JTB14_034012 [Gonioctena quinquepunctata]|nr:hypothetical protein JTB14_034012 [Gonioctena quinquepunctata]
MSLQKSIILLGIACISAFRVEKTGKYSSNGSVNILDWYVTDEPIIADVEEIAISGGQNFLNDDRGLIDISVLLNQNGSLISGWSCEMVDKARTDFCDRSLENDTLPTAPEEYAMDRLSLDFKSHPPELAIFCSLNCKNDINMNDSTILKALYVKKEKIDYSNAFNWTIDIPNFDYENNTLYGRHADILLINPGVLEFGKNYTVTVSFKDRSMTSLPYELITHIVPKLYSCTIHPEEGYALKTLFRWKCSHNNAYHHFEIFSVCEDGESLLQSGSYLEDMPFILDKNHEAEVKMMDEYHFVDSITMNVKVKSDYRNISTIEGLNNMVDTNFFDENSNLSLISLMESNEHDELIQALMIFSDELEDLPGNEEFRETIRDYDLIILDILGNVSLDTGTRARQFGTIISRISKRYENQSDPYIAMLSADICERASREYLEYIESDRHPKLRI